MVFIFSEFFWFNHATTTELIFIKFDKNYLYPPTLEWPRPMLVSISFFHFKIPYLFSFKVQELSTRGLKLLHFMKHTTSLKLVIKLAQYFRSSTKKNPKYPHKSNPNDKLNKPSIVTRRRKVNKEGAAVVKNQPTWPTINSTTKSE